MLFRGLGTALFFGECLKNDQVIVTIPGPLI